MSTTRMPAVAGAFYPASSSALAEAVDRCLAEARPLPSRSRACPKALVVPHAGYVYSGPIAGSAYALLAPHASSRVPPAADPHASSRVPPAADPHASSRVPPAERVERVVLVGPAHRVHVDGVVDPGATHLRTPLGDVVVDTGALAAIGALPGVSSSAAAHAREHSLEVQLPFLQRVVPHAKVVPLAVGRARPAEVARVLEALWGGPETVLVISSDLSHYLPYDTGRATDERTAERIVAFDPEPLTGDEACGAAALNGLLEVGRRRDLRAELVDLRSSGDTAGARDEVVGYGAFAFYETEVPS